MSVFRFCLLALTCYLPARVITADNWPPTKRLREWIIERTGQESAWSDLITCHRCTGVFVTGAIYSIDYFLWTIPLVLLMVGATMTLVGLIGAYDE